SEGVKLWDAKTGQQLTPRFAGSGMFSPDGQLVVGGTDGGTDGVRLLDAATGEPVTPILPAALGISHGSIRFFPDGSRLQTSDGQVWDISPEDRPLEELLLLTEVLTGKRIDVSGSLVPVGAERWRAAWRALRTQ